MVSRKVIQTYVDAVAREFQPERIILFGSYAYGKPTPDSDVDLLVVMPRRRWRRNTGVTIRTRLDYSGFPMDLLVWPDSRIQQRLEWGDGFTRDIVERGKVLYEAADA